ncbi:glycosyltransferase [Aureisphaera galaxeae]|uniref:glycosyltransferase n=1 Tax=Aureisphaera galaxeae TaxID=1538023 RepID=UPI00234FBC85|nr:glycosyltransferase [Aureisphaera galaxeae]MDC8005425.1 glycosyltransferase [Aureisphaera galaxeae]
MRILLARDPNYVHPQTHGAGKNPTKVPSGASNFQHDMLAKGLAENGHEVFFYVQNEEEMAHLSGVTFVDSLIEDVDIVHLKAIGDPNIIRHYQSKNIPILSTNHGNRPDVKPLCKWVYVSKTQALAHHSDTYVWNAMDPKDFIFSEKKQDYFLFMANARYHRGKGLDIALRLSKDLGFKLVVAGSSPYQKDIEYVEAQCREYNADYLGDVRGMEKAELITGAKALISPSRFAETFGMTIVEALFSGTPVICSGNGAYSEIMSETVGFVCNSEADYHHAVTVIDSIDPKVCRAYAMDHFHYRTMAKNYVAIYEEMISTQQPLELSI